MILKDQRKHPRVETSNLISFISYDSKGNLISQSMAKALNVSQSGILIETADRLELGWISLMSADNGNKLLEIKGQVVYSKKGDGGRYQTGISFQGSHDENVDFARELIKVFHHRKKSVLVAVSG